MNRRGFLVGGTAAVALACSRSDAARQGQRIVSIGGAITELIYALGEEAKLVGVDITSYYPEQVHELAQIGSHRRISAEGVIGLAPTLVIHSSSAGPESALAQLRDAEIETVAMPDPIEVEGARARISELAKLLGADARGQVILTEFDSSLAMAKQAVAKATKQPRVLFIYTRGADVMMAAGRRTSATAMIELAGGVSVFDHDEFLPVSAEAVVAAAPEVILVTSRGLESVGGEAGLLAHAALGETPAGKNRQVLSFDDLALLGFGPRTGATALELARALHPELA